MEVGARVIFTTFTVAVWHEGSEIVGEFSIFDIDAAVVSVEAAVTRHASGADAVESVDTKLGAVEKIDRLLAHAEEVTGFVLGQNRVDGLQHFRHAVGRKNPADAEAVHRLARTIACGLCTQIKEGAALHHGI